MPVLRGRTFAPGTAGNGEMVINEALARSSSRVATRSASG
jgi:hypothetical protein